MGVCIREKEKALNQTCSCVLLSYLGHLNPAIPGRDWQTQQTRKAEAKRPHCPNIKVCFFSVGNKHPYLKTTFTQFLSGLASCTCSVLFSLFDMFLFFVLSENKWKMCFTCSGDV